MNHSTLEIFIQVAETQSVTRQQNGWAAHSPISRPAFSSWKRSLPLSSSFAATKNGVVPGRRAVSQLCPADPEPGGRGKAGSASDNPRRQSASGRDGGDRRQPAAAAAYPLPTAVPAGGYHPHHPTDPPVNRGVLTAALDAALVCLPPGPMGNRPVPPSWHSPRCFMKP